MSLRTAAPTPGVEQIRIDVSGETDVARATLQAGKMGKRAGFGEVDRCMIATAVSELSRNILKYAGRGQVLVRLVDDGCRSAVEVVASDRGPGIRDPQRALQDHYSSSGTLGLGLPGVRRMMDEFELDSGPEAGTRVVARKWR